MSSPLTADTNREAWLAARRKGIGASEIAAVLGISPWESPFSLYWRKVNGWDYEPSAEMEWGTRLEPVIADKWEAAHPEWDVTPGALEEHPFYPWMLATPDRVLYRTTSLMPDAVLELKTARSADGWGEPGTADIPVYYRAQVLWQMQVVEARKAFVAVLIGGSDYREYEIPYDRRDIDVMVEAGRRFMHRIEIGDPPPIDDHQATLAAVKRLHPDLIDQPVDVPEDLARAYEWAVYRERLARRVKDRYEIRLRAAMGDYRTAYRPDGRRVATRVITDVAESTTTRAAHRRDYLLPPKEGKK